MFPIARFVLALGALSVLCSAASAVPINNASGLATPVTELHFDEFGSNGVLVQDQYTALGVQLSTPIPTLYSDPFEGLDLWALNGNDNIQFQFLGTVNEAAVSFATNPGLSTFTALLDGVVVEQLESPTTITGNGSGQLTYFGFQGIVFDTLAISAGGTNGAYRLDNLQFGDVTPSSGRTDALVSEPGALALGLVGVAMLVGAGRRESEQHRRIARAAHV